MSVLLRIIFSGNLQTRRPLSSSLVRLAKRQDNESSSDSESSSDDERKAKKSSSPKDNTKADAKNKLNALLKSMLQEESNYSSNSKKLNLAKPREKQRKKDLDERERKDQKKFGEKLIGAAKEAAEELGGNVKQTETELLARLLYKGKLAQEDAKQETTSPSTDSTHAKKEQKKALGSFTLNELLAGMKIDHSQPKEVTTHLEPRADQVRSFLKTARTSGFVREKFTSKRLPSDSKGVIPGERVDLFGAEPLGIFKTTDLAQKKDDEASLETWERCFSRELKLATTQPPTNIYEQMIMWTEKGMLWHFPIDNEQGLEEEKKVHFYEHVHLEQHLQGWCPSKGPIRHFMELVCVGLSKNPWLTVDEKLQHIWWFRDFFGDKASLIKEIGAGEIKIESKKQAST